MATKILHENNGYGIQLWEQVCDELQHHKQVKTGTTRTKCSSPSTTPMTTLTHCTCTSTDACRTCTGTARIFVPQLVMIHAHLMAQVLSASITPICMDIHGALSLIRLLPFLLSLPPVCLRLPLPPLAVHWAPKHEVHGKQPALLRCRREWGHPERLHLSHTFLCQTTDPTVYRPLRSTIELCLEFFHNDVKS